MDRLWDPLKSDHENLAAHLRRREQELGLEGLSPKEKHAALQRSTDKLRARVIEKQRQTLERVRAMLASAMERGDDETVIAAYQHFLERQEQSLARSLAEQATPRDSAGSDPTFETILARAIRNSFNQ